MGGPRYQGKKKQCRGETAEDIDYSSLIQSLGGRWQGKVSKRQKNQKKGKKKQPRHGTRRAPRKLMDVKGERSRGGG